VETDAASFGGNRAGVRAPDAPRVFPRRLPQPTRRHLARRGKTIARVAARHFAPLAVRQARSARHGPLPASELARPLRRTFEDLGGTFMKFGQLVASSPGVFGDGLAEEFRSCLDTGPPVPFDLVKSQVEDDLGMALSDAYAELEEEPVGRASIAVVHRGRLHDGRVVAVKVLRPGIEKLVAADLDLLQPLLELVAHHTGDQTAGSLLQMFEGFREQIGEELDLRNEARAMVHFRKILADAGIDVVVVPEVVEELSGPNVLTMQFLDGVPIDDLAKVERYGVDPGPLVEEVLRAFFVMTLRFGAFHGDVHAGNLLLLQDGRVGVLDWGIVGRLDPDTYAFFRRILEAALGDETAWNDVAAHMVRVYGPALEAGLGLDEAALSKFMRATLEPVLTRPFGEVSLGELLTAPQAQVARARGLEAQSRSVRAIFTRLMAQRKMRRMAEAHGGISSSFDRGTFLLGKQLLYFERYGKLFMADTPLLSDREFFERLLVETAQEDGAASDKRRG
jgi:predicted unusual protein kinase regulating ubiquinone biosynthesis (AarF/ABC1/UbiB family)